MHPLRLLSLGKTVIIQIIAIEILMTADIIACFKLLLIMMKLSALVHLVNLKVVDTSLCIHSFSLYIVLAGAHEVNLAVVVVMMMLILLSFVQSFSAVAC